MNRGQFIHLVAHGLNEWERRFLEEPDRFAREFQTAREFDEDEQAGAMPRYGLVGALFMARLLDDIAGGLDATEPMLEGGDPALPRGWERLAATERAEATCALADALEDERMSRMTSATITASPEDAERIGAIMEQAGPGVIEAGNPDPDIAVTRDRVLAALLAASGPILESEVPGMSEDRDHTSGVLMGMAMIGLLEVRRDPSAGPDAMRVELTKLGRNRALAAVQEGGST